MAIDRRANGYLEHRRDDVRNGRGRDSPFRGVTSSHTIVQILEKDPVPLSKLGNAPPELERIVEKAMAKSPDERYQTAKDMLIDLRSLKKRLDLEMEIQRTSSLRRYRFRLPRQEVVWIRVRNECSQSL